MKAIVRVILLENVNDTHGASVKSGLHLLGFTQVNQVRYGRLFQLDLEDTDPDLARERVAQMCDKLLANLLIEQYEIEIIDGKKVR